MKFKIGFSAEEKKENPAREVRKDSKAEVKPKPSLVDIRFPDIYKSYTYYNDRFDLHEGDTVFVDGKLTCDCYSAGMCEHEIAVLFELRHKLKWTEENCADDFQKTSYFAELDKAAFCNMVLMSRQNGSFQIG